MPRNEPNVHYAAIGKALSVPVAAAAKRADEQKTRAAWLEAFSLAARVDSAAPTADSKFYLGLSAFQIGIDVLGSTDASCRDVTLAESMWATAQIEMPKGARAGERQAQAAAAVLTAITKYQGSMTSAKRAACRRK